MYEFEHSLETDATPAAIFGLYSDVSLWPLWDPGLQKLELDGAFATGTQGTMTFFGQEPLPYILTDVQPYTGFSDETRIPGTDVVICFQHTLTPISEGRTRITHRVTVSGEGAENIGPSVSADIPEAMAAMAEHTK